MGIKNRLGKFRDYVVKHFHMLMQIPDSPQAIAGGVSVGIFYGFVPLFIPFVPLKTVLSALTAWALRCSKMAAVIAVTAHDILLPVWWYVLLWEYRIGFWLLHHSLPPKLKEKVHSASAALHPELKEKGHSATLHPEHWFSMETFKSWSDWVRHMISWKSLTDILFPMLIGSIIIGVPVAAICFVITLKLVKKTQTAVILKTETLKLK